MKHLERALDGQNQWWKYLLVFFIALILGQSVGAIPIAVVIGIKVATSGGDFIMPENKADLSAFGIDPNLGLVLMIIPFLVTLVLAILLIKAFHRRSLKDVINGGGRFRWKRFLTGFGIWGVLVVIYMIADIQLHPDNFEFRFNAMSFIPLVLISVLLIPFQSGTEEYLFRGYLAQGVAGWTKQRWLVIVIPSVFFALMHGLNPEAKEYGFWTVMPQYFLFAVVFGMMAILDDGIEIAIGTHSANNIFSSIFVTSKASALQTPALFLQKEVDPWREFWLLLVVSVVFIATLTFIYKWDFSVLSKKVIKDEMVE